MGSIGDIGYTSRDNFWRVTMDQNAKKQAVAKAAIDYVEQDSIVGVGTGSTVNFFIEELGKIKHKIEGAV